MQTRPFEVCGSQSDQENASLGGARVAIGPRKHRLGGARTTIRLRKHVTSRGPGHNRAEKTLHSEGPESQSDSKNTVHPGPGGPADRKNTQFTRARSHPAASGGPPGRPRDPYRGFAHVGRSGPQTVRSGQKVDGKTRYSRNPNQRTLRKKVPIITGDRRSFN